MTKKKFLSPQDIDAAIAEVAQLATEARVDIALIGGVAMSLHGSDRLTVDVDFAATSPIPWLAGHRRSLSFGGDALTTSAGHPVDIVVRSDDYAPLYEEAIETAVAVEGIPVKVVRADYLAAMKMAAGRDKDEIDLKTLIRLKIVPFSEVAIIVRRHLGVYAVRELRNLYDEVAWLLSRGEE